MENGRGQFVLKVETNQDSLPLVQQRLTAVTLGWLPTFCLVRKESINMIAGWF